MLVIYATGCKSRCRSPNSLLVNPSFQIVLLSKPQDINFEDILFEEVKVSYQMVHNRGKLIICYTY